MNVRMYNQSNKRNCEFVYRRRLQREVCLFVFFVSGGGSVGVNKGTTHTHTHTHNKQHKEVENHSLLALLMRGLCYLSLWVILCVGSVVSTGVVLLLLRGLIESRSEIIALT
jgi:hypothetical protein